MAGPGFASGYDRAATGAAAREEAAAAAVLMSSALTARDACFYLKKPLADLGVTAKMVEESYTVKGKHHPNGGINADVAALFADRAPPGAVLCLESGHLRTVKALVSALRKDCHPIVAVSNHPHDFLSALRTAESDAKLRDSVLFSLGDVQALCQEIKHDVFGAVYLDCGQHPKTMIPCVESIIASGALADGALLVLQPTDSNLKEGALQDQMGLLEFAAATAAKAGGYKVAKLTELALHKRHPNLPLLVLQLTAGAGRKSATAPGAPAGSAGVARVMLGHLQRKLQLLPGSGKCYVKGDTPKTAHARLGCSDAHILDDDTGRLAPCKKCAPCAAGGKLLQASSILEGAPKWLDVPAAAPVAPVAAAGAAPLAAAPAAALSAAPAATVVALAAPAAAKARTQAAPDVCFVTDKGNKKHRSRACRTLSKSTVLQKSVAEAEAHGKKEWCKVCPKD